MIGCSIRVGRDSPANGSFDWAILDASGSVRETGTSSLGPPPYAGPCRLVVASELVLLDRNRSNALDAPDALDRELVDAEHLDLDDAAVGHAGLELLRRALRNDHALRDHGDPVAERICLEHVVRRQEHGLTGLGE